VFQSDASNLVPGDTNGLSDVFVHDRVTGTTERVSVASDGTQANGPSEGSSISADGRFVVFDSNASNLVAGDTNGAYDVFIHDRLTGTTERVSTDSTNSEVAGGGSSATISGDGRYVAFDSTSPDLVPNDTNGGGVYPHSGADIFVKDLMTGAVERVSVATDGTQSDGDASNVSYPAISSDGRFVVWTSTATNLVPDDTNDLPDVFLRDRMLGTTERVSVSSTGAQGGRSQGNDRLEGLSDDGRFVAFQSSSSELTGNVDSVHQIFVRDRSLGVTEQITIGIYGFSGNCDSTSPAISPDGRFVAFQSCAGNLVSGGGTGSVFIHDLSTGVTGLIQNSTDSVYVAVATTGIVSFDSGSTDLVANDTNGFRDIFVRTPECGDGITDIGEQCDGGTCCTVSCEVIAAGTVCRPSAGLCDIPESCTGTSGDCPPDEFASGTVCRPAAGPCDVEESCTGTAPDCPADAFLSSGTVCRPSTGPCDAPESCTGTSAACPPDGPPECPTTSTSTTTITTTTTTPTTTTQTTSTTTTTSTSSTTLFPPCPSAPASGCQGALTQRAQIKIGKGAIPSADKLTWKWVSSGSVATGDFGDPTTTAGYALCTYDQTGLVMTATAPAGGTCGTKPCWSVSSTGAKYTNKLLTPDGLLKISLKAGGAGAAKISVKGKGALLPIPTLPLSTPVRVQLVREDSGTCWEANYSTVPINTPTALKAKSD
jgi:hypothetical protein